MIKNKIKFRFLSIFSIICLCIGNTIKGLQNDTFYVIKLGDYIVHHGIDMLDHYCWITKLSYTYPHWLYDVFLYYINNLFGYRGIYYSSIVLFIILILVVYFVNLKIHKNEFLSLFVSLISIVCLYGFATARAQLVSAILFFLEVFFIERLIKTGKNRYIIYLMIDSLLIANIHGTAWMMFFVLFLPFLGEKIFYSVFKKIKVKRLYKCSINYFGKLLLGFVLSFMMGLFTPSRICYTYVFRVMLGDSQKYIIEHFPLVIINYPVFLVVILLLLFVLIFTNIKVYLRELFMIFGLVFMCFLSVRHLTFFYLIGFLYISIICVRVLNDRKDKTFDILYYYVVRYNFIYISIFALIIFISYFSFDKNYSKDYVSLKEYPVDAVSYIKDNLYYKNIKIYNNYNIGSYLLYKDVPVFVDSRCDLYLSEFNGMKYSIFDDEMNMYKNYEKKFVKYGVEYALISRSDIMYRIIKKDSNYNTIYEDKYFVLFKVVDDE